ncbi:MAG: HNH endonuclease signature motif containing protein [Ilumatobacteraceae bacterium]
MDVTAVCERVAGVAAARAAAVAGTADRAVLESGLRSVAVVRAWLAAAEVDLAAALAGLVSFPEGAIADAGRGSQAEAERVLERGRTLEETPSLAGALGAGEVTAAHVDVVTKAAKGLDDEAQRAALLARADGLARFAAGATVTEFRRKIDDEVRAVQSGDGMERLVRQRRASRLRRWVDGDGMWCLFGRFDPLTGVRLSGRLDAEVEAFFAESVPEDCPSDPMAKQEFLAALALAQIFDGGGVAPRAGRPEFVVVIEADGETEAGGAGDAADGAGGESSGSQREPRVDWGLPVEVPYRVLVELFGEADVFTVIVRNGVVLHAPGELNLGRTTRLANRAQRRALRALYRGCGVPGCGVRFDRCKIHHVVWWRHGGRTDLENLLPLCPHHHSLVHAAGWVITLGPNRELTLRLPDGTIHNTGPPSRKAA